MSRPRQPHPGDTGREAHPVAAGWASNACDYFFTESWPNGFLIPRPMVWLGYSPGIRPAR